MSAALVRLSECVPYYPLTDELKDWLVFFELELCAHCAARAT